MFAIERSPIPPPAVPEPHLSAPGINFNALAPYEPQCDVVIVKVCFLPLIHQGSEFHEAGAIDIFVLFKHASPR